METKRHSMSLLLVALLLAASQFVTVGTVQAADSLLTQMGDEIAQIAEETTPAVVSIFSTKVEKRQVVDPFEQFERYFGPGFNLPHPKMPKEQEYRRTGLGSGFFIDEDGTILTNSHVVDKSDEIKVLLANGEEYAAEVLGTDPESEVAVIQVKPEDGKMPDITVAPIGDSDKVRVGHFSVAIGSPQGLKQSVTFGIVSAMNRSELRITDFGNFIQTDAPINRGNSGGPLLNAQGEVIGINTAIISTSGGSQGLGLAIPINQAIRIAEMIQKDGKVSRGYLGILMQSMDPETAEFLGAKGQGGVVVMKVMSDTPAEDKLEENDAIISVNGEPVKDSQDVLNRIASLSPGSKVKIGIVREGKEKTVTIKLTTRPSKEELMAGRTGGVAEEDEQPLQSEDTDMGLTVRALTETEAREKKLEGGLLITKVEDGSTGAKVGLQPGMVIEQVNLRDVHNLDELEDALEAGKKKDQVLLRVASPMGSMLVTVPKK